MGVYYHIYVKFMNRFLAKIIGSIVIIFVIVGGSISAWQISKFEVSDVKKVVRVEAGEGLLDVSRKLKHNSLVSHRGYFHLMYFLYGRGRSVAPGGYRIASAMPMKDMVYALSDTPWAKSVEIPAGVTKDEIGEIVGKTLGWSELDKQFFSYTYAGMQWQRYHERVESEFVAKYGWEKGQRETFLGLSSLYKEPEYDFFKKLYEPGTYEIPAGSSRAQVAGILIDRFSEKHGDNEYANMIAMLDRASMDAIAKLIEEEMELMPDIAAIPPGDVTLKKENGKTYLLFTTSYWNRGRGPLELVADHSTKNIKGDLERKVFQRIYTLDGDYRERLSGSFLWHQTHLHYHFADFATYRLDGVEVEGSDFKISSHLKSTFCIRDSEPIALYHPGADKKPSYTICGKERQGISSGWADSYYYTYVDQRFDVTNASKGVYLLTIDINPEDRFEEITKVNNKSEVLMFLNVEDGFVDVLEERS